MRLLEKRTRGARRLLAARARLRPVLGAALAAAILVAARGTAPAALRVTTASWSGSRQRLTVAAREAPALALAVVYDGERYPMTYSREKRTYQLSLAPARYAPRLTVVSSSGSSAASAVAVADGWVTMETFQLLDHGAAPPGQAPGHALAGDRGGVCVPCHEEEDDGRPFGGLRQPQASCARPAGPAPQGAGAGRAR